MNSAAGEVQRAVFAALAGDGALTHLLGGARIHDRAPADARFPYVTFGRTSVQDWSTGSEAGSEQILSIHVWSKARGRREALDIAARVRTCLHDRPLALTGHRLVLLRAESGEARFEADIDVHHVVVRLRALTEAISGE